jgi:hypothetical protein
VSRVAFFAEKSHPCFSETITPASLQEFADFVRIETGEPNALLAVEILDIAKRMREGQVDDNGAFTALLDATEKYPHPNDKRARVVDITNINKVDLLEKLCRGQKAAVFFKTNGIPVPIFDRNNAEKAIANGYIDYYSGKAIKMDLSKNVVDPWLYNRDAGDGAFEEIVRQLSDTSANK